MSQEKKSRTRTIIFIIIFAIIAMLIIFMSQRNEYASHPYGTGGALSVDYYDGDESFAQEPSMLERGMEKMAMNNDAGMVMEESISPESARMPTPPIAGDPTVVDKKIVKVGNVTMMVNDVDAKVREISDIARSVGGDVMSANVNESTYGLKNGTVVVKVPSEKFSQAFDNIAGVASVVTHKSQSAQDVTEQFIDLEAQLKNKKEEEKRISHLYNKADEIEDILKIETQMSRVRGEIERMEGRLRYLGNQSSFSTITARLSEDTKIIASSGQWRPWQDAKEAMRILVERTQNLISNLIVFTISKLPFILISLIGLLILIKIGKVIFRKLSQE